MTYDAIILQLKILTLKSWRRYRTLIHVREERMPKIVVSFITYEEALRGVHLLLMMAEICGLGARHCLSVSHITNDAPSPEKGHVPFLGTPWTW